MPKRQEILFRQIVVACDVATLVLSCGAAYWIRDDLLRSGYCALSRVRGTNDGDPHIPNIVSKFGEKYETFLKRTCKL